MSTRPYRGVVPADPETVGVCPIALGVRRVNWVAKAVADGERRERFQAKRLETKREHVRQRQRAVRQTVTDATRAKLDDQVEHQV